jgi:CRISPR-associated protein Cas1
MIKKTISISNPFHLSCKNNQLVLNSKKEDKQSTIPIEDIGFLIIDSLQVTLSTYLINELIKNNVALVFSDEKHHPRSLLLNLDGNHTQSEIFRHQINASAPLKKQLWQQTIIQKIKNQEQVLSLYNTSYPAMINFASKVKSGDTTNEEAKAAKYYWNQLFEIPFRRSRLGDAPNNLLNYGYAILRATVARALVSSGLLPTLGIHHKNKYNAYCLADDIMEPYRPFVDVIVLKIMEQGETPDDLTPEIKKHLLEIITADTIIGGKKRPLMTAVSESTASLAKCYKGESTKLKFPQLCI